MADSSSSPQAGETDALMLTTHMANVSYEIGKKHTDAPVPMGSPGRQYPPTIDQDESFFVSPNPEPDEQPDDNSYGPSDLSLNRRHSRRRRDPNNLTNSLLRRTHLKGSPSNGNDESSLQSQSSKFTRARLSKTNASFMEDAKNFSEGTIPQSIVVATVIGVVTGAAAWLYYTVLYYLLDLIWTDAPQKLVVETWQWPEEYYVLWIPLVGFVMAILTGLTVVVLGEPGDLAYTIKCVHDKAYISMGHVTPMAFASLFSILGGGSLGPEAPLVAICAAIAGYISRRVFKQTNRNTVRKHTLMGMAGALAAFFGCPLGGSLFALEVNSRFGIEYFEHLVESIFCGEVCLVTFRAMCGIPIASIWNISENKMTSSSPTDVLLGAVMGLFAAAIAACFSTFHWKVMDIFGDLGLLDNERAVVRALIGCTVIVGLGMLVPQTMFWSEEEFETIATMAPDSTLTHIWPPEGLTGFEMNTGFRALVVGVTKIIAISFTVAGGYRGGFIFPFFGAGAAFGRAFTSVFTFIPPQLAVLCFAAGINVAITRTVLATTIILCYHSGEQQAIGAVLAASLVSLFATSYMPFINTQIVRQDLDSSLFHLKNRDKPLMDSYHENLGALGEVA